MKKDENILKILSAIKDINIPKYKILNSAKNETLSLKDQVIIKLHNAIFDDFDDTEASYFEWFLKDFKKCQNKEQFVAVLENNYSEYGELIDWDSDFIFDYEDDNGEIVKNKFIKIKKDEAEITHNHQI